MTDKISLSYKKKSMMGSQYYFSVAMHSSKREFKGKKGENSNINHSLHKTVSTNPNLL